METLIHFAEYSQSPLLIVIAMAVVFALDPCLILTNIAAIGYLSKDIESRGVIFFKGLYYALGRFCLYFSLSTILILLIYLGKDVDSVKAFIGNWGEVIVFVYLILMGLIMCLGNLLSLKGIGFTNIKINKGYLGAYFLGVVLSFAICPTNAVIFVGMLVPAAIASIWSIVLIFIFSTITVIPVIITAYIIAFSFNSVARYYDKIKKISNIFRYIIGIIFILIGMYMCINYFTRNNHLHDNCTHPHCTHTSC